MFDTLLLQAASYHKTWRAMQEADPLMILRLCTEYGGDRIWEIITEQDGGKEALFAMCQNLSAPDEEAAKNQNHMMLAGSLVRYFGEEVRIRFEYQQQKMELETA